MQPQQLPSYLVDANDLPPGAHGHDALVERVDERRQERVLGLKRLQPRAKLLGHPVDRRGEIAHFAGRRQGGAAREVAGRERLRDVAKLDDGPRHVARHEHRQHEGDEHGQPTREQHIAAGLGDDRPKLSRADGHARGAERRAHRYVELLIACRGAEATGDADPPVVVRGDHLVPVRVIFEARQCRAVELGVADHVTGGVDQRDAMPDCRARHVGKRVGGRAVPPLSGDEPCLTSELLDRGRSQLVLQPLAAQDDDEDDEDADDEERAEQKALAEPHEPRAPGARKR